MELLYARVSVNDLLRLGSCAGGAACVQKLFHLLPVQGSLSALQHMAPACGKGSLACRAGFVNLRNVNDFSTQTYPAELVQCTYAQLLKTRFS